MLITILDVDAAFAHKLQSQLEPLLALYDVAAQVSICSDPQSLLLTARNSIIDLAFLALALGPTDGFSVADQLCRINMETQIVFVTSHVERMARAFDYRPVGFLAKPVGSSELQRTFERFLFFSRHPQLCYSIVTRAGTIFIKHRDILFFEISGHNALLYTSTDDMPIRFTKRLDDIQAELAPFGFIRTHKSFLVNPEAIASLRHDQSSFVLRDGSVIPISRNRYSNAVSSYLEYVTAR